jgi:MFS family permease
MVEYKWTVLSNTTLGMLLASLDGTIVLISLPVIFRGIGVDPFLPSSFPLLIWMLLGYGVVTATLLVSFGRLSDMWGRARMYNLGFAVFSTGSIFLFLEPYNGTTGAWLLVIFRLVQATGAAFLFANSAALLTDAFPPRERGLAIGVNQIAFIGGALFGLIVGGVLAGIPDIHIGPYILPTWRIIFLVSVPVGVIGTIWAYLQLKEISIRKAGQHVDFLGNATFGTALVLLLVSVTYGLLPYQGAAMGWSDPWVDAGLVTGALLLGLFLFIETRVKDPMFRLELFRQRAFAAGISAAFLGSVARGGMMLMMVLWLQGIWLPLHGYALSQTPLYAGLMLAPMMVGFVVAGPISGRLSDRQGARTLSTTGMALGSATFLLLALLPTDFQYWELGIILFAQGIGMGMFASPNAAAVMNSVPPENRGAASGMLATLQNVGQQASMAVFFTIVILGLSSGLGGSVHSALTTAQVPAGDQALITPTITSSPTGSLFGAFLGENPMQSILYGNGNIPGVTASPMWQPLPTSVMDQIQSSHFFAVAIASAFSSAISEAFLFAAAVTGLAAVISSQRGKVFIYDEQTKREVAVPPPSAPSPSPSPSPSADARPSTPAVVVTGAPGRQS